MSELDALHRRIAELERSLATGGGASPALHVMRLVGMGIVAALLGAIPGRACAPRPESILVQSVPEPPPIPAGVLSLADGAGPSLADVDGDGAKDLVVRAWRSGQDDAPLHAVAIDRRTHDVRWRAGPWPAEARNRGRSIVLDRRVIVTDAAPRAHVLDLGTGAEVGAITLPRPAQVLRAIPGDASHVYVELARNEAAGESKGAIIVLDLSVGIWRPLHDAEERPDRDACPPDGSSTCVVHHDPSLAGNVAHLYPSVYGSADVYDGKQRFTIVDVIAGGGPGHIEHALVWDDAARRPRWRSPLVPPSRRWEPYPNTAPQGHTALGGGRITHVYPTISGEYRVTGRALDTGLVLYDAALPGIEYGTTVASLTAEGDDAFVVAGGALAIVDARTGAVSARIDAF